MSQLKRSTPSASGEVRKFLDRLRSQAIIVWKNEDLKKAYEQALKRGVEPARLH